MVLVNEQVMSGPTLEGNKIKRQEYEWFMGPVLWHPA